MGARRIIEPLASRCSKFRFTPLDSSSAAARLSYIATNENVAVSPPVIDTLIATSGGDLRRAITYLQSASRLSSSTDPPTPITPVDIQEIAGVVPDGVIDNFARAVGIEVDGSDAMDVDGLQRRGFQLVQSKVKEVMREGYSATQILTQVSPQFTLLALSLFLLRSFANGLYSYTTSSSCTLH